MMRVLLAVGANLGPRERTLASALAALARLPGTTLLARSSWHQTIPVGGPAGQAPFLNGAVTIQTALSPPALANSLRQIETQLGRQRLVRWDARTIDLDMLLYADRVLTSPELNIPHPRMAVRRFVLDPACEIAGDMIHPTSGWTLAAIQRHWQLSPRTVAIEAADSSLADWLSTELTRQLASNTGAPPGHDAVQLLQAHQGPAMVIALDDAPQRAGPMVRITSRDRAAILEESLAAIRSAWPN